MKLTSTLSADGILTVQAPVPPQYQAVVGPQHHQPQQLQAAAAPPSLSVNIQSNANAGGRSSPFQTIQQQHQQQQQAMRVSPVPMSVLHQQHHQMLQTPVVVSATSPAGRASPRLGGPPSPSPFDMPTFGHDATTGRRRLDLVVDLGSTQYSPENVSVKLDGRRLSVEAKFEVTDRPGRVSTTTTQKQYDLGEDIDASTIRASIGADGRLSVTALV